MGCMLLVGGLRGVLRPPLRPKTSTECLAATRHPLGRHGILQRLDAVVASFCLPSRPALAGMATASGVALLVGCARSWRLPLCRASFAKACASSRHFGAAHWVWTTHPTPASGLASGCTRVAAKSGAPGLCPPPPTGCTGVHPSAGATASVTIAGQCVGLLAYRWRLPPPMAAPAGAGLPSGDSLDAHTPPASGRLPLYSPPWAVSSALALGVFAGYRPP